MSFLDKVTKGKIKKPLFMCIYGDSGVGKTTLAASAPNPLFLATEEGTNDLDVARLQLDDWDSSVGALKELCGVDTEYQTIVLDSLDHLETKIHNQVALDQKKDSIEEIGYAKGYIFALKYWEELLNYFRVLRGKGKHIILISHGHVKTQNDPRFSEPFDRHELKLHRKAADLIKESVDMLFFLSNDISLAKDKNQSKAKAFDMKKRYINTEFNAAFDAKNRCGLPERIEFNKEGAFNEILKATDLASGDNSEAMFREIEAITSTMVDKETAEKALNYAKENKSNNAELKATLDRLVAITRGEE